MAQSLYETLGGTQAIGPIVLAFYDKVVESEKLRHFFANVDMQRLVDHQAKYIASILGGPAYISTNELEAVHSHIEISDEDFDLMMNLFESALQENSVSAENTKEICASMAAMRGFVVGLEDRSPA